MKIKARAPLRRKKTRIELKNGENNLWFFLGKNKCFFATVFIKNKKCLV